MYSQQPFLHHKVLHYIFLLIHHFLIDDTEIVSLNMVLVQNLHLQSQRDGRVQFVRVNLKVQDTHHILLKFFPHVGFLENTTVTIFAIPANIDAYKFKVWTNDSHLHHRKCLQITPIIRSSIVGALDSNVLTIYTFNTIRELP